MIRQRVLTWAAVLALVATVQIAPLPAQYPVPVAALAQETPPDPGESTDLAVVALHCADAPTTEALTSFFGNGTPPSGCAPGVGVTVAVEEDGSALPGSPFAT